MCSIEVVPAAISRDSSAISLARRSTSFTRPSRWGGEVKDVAIYSIKGCPPRVTRRLVVLHCQPRRRHSCWGVSGGWHRGDGPLRTQYRQG